MGEPDQGEKNTRLDFRERADHTEDGSHRRVLSLEPSPIEQGRILQWPAPPQLESPSPPPFHPGGRRHCRLLISVRGRGGHGRQQSPPSITPSSPTAHRALLVQSKTARR